MKKLLRIFEHLLTLVVGLGACTTCYGVPYTEFVLDGRVNDSENGKGIPGIKVTAEKHGKDGKVEWIADPVYTNENGVYVMYPPGTPNRVTFEDVDGEENGLYSSKSVQMEGAYDETLNVTMDQVK